MYTPKKRTTAMTQASTPVRDTTVRFRSNPLETECLFTVWLRLLGRPHKPVAI